MSIPVNFILICFEFFCLCFSVLANHVPYVCVFMLITYLALLINTQKEYSVNIHGTHQSKLNHFTAWNSSGYAVSVNQWVRNLIIVKIYTTTTTKKHQPFYIQSWISKHQHKIMQRVNLWGWSTSQISLSAELHVRYITLYMIQCKCSSEDISGLELWCCVPCWGA